jgi:fluoride exporter
VTAPVLLALGVAGGLGALARFLADGDVAGRLGREFPFGTLVVNLSGSFALGVVVGAAVHGDAYRLAATGFLGAYTTFSTWMFESQRLAEDGELSLAGVNVVVSLLLGVVVIWAGRHLGSAL